MKRHCPTQSADRRKPSMMEYHAYIGKVEFDDEASIFHGKVINTRDVIRFQGKSVAELKKAFRESVDDYLEFCAKRGEEPDKPFSGQFVTRVSPDLHRRVSVAASVSGKSLNAWVTLDAGESGLMPSPHPVSRFLHPVSRASWLYGRAPLRVAVKRSSCNPCCCRSCGRGSSCRRGR
jgi:predicted HicB family RNase H-like nuclease